jgi:membrane-bound ClpP family serine protease
MALYAPMQFGVDDLVRNAIESIRNKKDKICIVLETEGGVIQTTERIANSLRHFYPNHVSFIVPNFAMSAGTILVMCGDEIMMDYYSVLGPIDPQVKKGDKYVPALGYLEQFERLKSRGSKLSTAEVILLDKFDPAEMYQFEEARELSVSLLKDWLKTYKFKDWDVTQSKKKPVTPAMRAKRAEEIARKLNNTKMWHSHGRGISMKMLQSDVNIQIRDFGLEPSLNSAVKGYTTLLQDYMGKRGHSIACHVSGLYVGIGGR